MNENHANTLLDPYRWGLPLEAVQDLAEQLYRFWERFQGCFQTKTRNPSKYAYHYLSGQLRMDTERNFANIGRQAGVAEQNVQHFMSNSPWPAQAVFEQVQADIAVPPGLQTGGVLLLDESADEKSGAKSAGAGRQYNGRLGKVEMSQVGTFLAYANLSGLAPVWSWVEGELFLPEHWFTPAMAEERRRLGIPAQRQFATKVELGWAMIQRVKARGVLPFEAVACDDLYGRSGWLRRQLDEAHLTYMADVPENTSVYLTPPDFDVPPLRPDRRGRRPSRPRVLNEVAPVEVRQVVRRADTSFRLFRVRSTERGVLEDPFAMRRVWTIRDGQRAEEWLVIRLEAGKRYSYALSNAPVDTSHERLAWLKCIRHFIERANQDAKSEAGWDEFQAQKYRAWEHHLALTVLATWFVAQTKWEWAQQYGRDPSLAGQFAVDMLPALSMANVRELLKAVMPLPQLTPEQASALVVKHLVNRTRSRKSRLKHKARASS